MTISFVRMLTPANKIIAFGAGSIHYGSRSKKSYNLVLQHCTIIWGWSVLSTSPTSDIGWSLPTSFRLKYSRLTCSAVAKPNLTNSFPCTFGFSFTISHNTRLNATLRPTFMLEHSRCGRWSSLGFIRKFGTER